MFLMTIFYTHPLTDTPRQASIACFDSQDALNKLKEFVEIFGRECIVALATDFEFSEGWGYIING
jgi:hypothetical protein